MQKLLFFVVFVVSIPVLVINFYNPSINKKIFGFIENKKEEVVEEYHDIPIRVLRSNGNIETMNLEDYLIGVVPSESPLILIWIL